MDLEQIAARTPLKRRRLLFSKAKLKAVSRTSALLSGFAMVSDLFFLYVLDEYNHLTKAFLSIEQVAMVEISLDDHKNSTKSAPLLVVYSVITCLLVGVHLLALMISTCILPQLEADSLLGYEEYASHETMHIYIELAWILSTGFGRNDLINVIEFVFFCILGIFLFLVEIAIVCWVKFYVVARAAAVATTIVIVPVIILFCVFSLHFYRRLVSFKLSRHQDELNEIETTLTVGRLAQANVV
jgi:hypothetical protein